MKKVFKGLLAREKAARGLGALLFTGCEPKMDHEGFWLCQCAGAYCGIGFEPTHGTFGLRPGQKRKATLTVEVED